MAGEFDRRRRVIVDGAQRHARRALRDAQGRVLRLPERLRPLRQAREGRRAPGLGGRLRLPARRGAHRHGGGRRLRLRRPHPPLVRDGARDHQGRACAAWTRPSARSRGEGHEDRGLERHPRRPREQVWDAFLDPERPRAGHPRLREARGDRAGRVQGHDEGRRGPPSRAPSRARCASSISSRRTGTAWRSRARGGPGFVRGDAGMELSDADGGTRVATAPTCRSAASSRASGQRMLGGVIEDDARPVLLADDGAPHRRQVAPRA